MIFDLADISPESRAELIAQWDRLIEVGLLSKELPPGFTFVPLVEPEWRIADVGPDGEQEYVFVHSIVLNALALGIELAPMLSTLAKRIRKPKRNARLAVWRRLAIRTFFLPIWLVFDRPFPNYPGSQFTQGMAIVGFLAMIAVFGFVVAAATGYWTVAVTCAYWWLGSKLLQQDARAQGFIV